MLVASFIDKIRSVLENNDPIQVVEEFDKWIKFFANEKRKMLEVINVKMVKEIENFKGSHKNKDKEISWFREERVIVTKQLFSEIVDNEAQAISKIDHQMYFRRRFLKNKLIYDEINELRDEESSLK